MKEELSPSNRFLENAWTCSGDAIRLLGSLCGNCGHRFFPEKPMCSNCGQEDSITRVELSSLGSLYTFTVVHVAPRGFQIPYAVGFIDLDDGVRVFAQIEEPAESLAIGQRVSPVSGTIFTRQDGIAVESFKFRRVRS